MRVLNVMSRFNVGGTSQFLYHLTKEMDAQGIENLILIGDCSFSETEDVRILGLNVANVKGLGPDDSLLQSLMSIFRIRKIIKSYRPDIVNTHTSKAGFIGRIANTSLISRPKLIHTFHGHVFHGYFSSIIENLVKVIERFLMQFTDLVIVVGDRVLQDLKNFGIIRNKPTITVWPYVPEFTLGNKVELRKSMGISQDSTVIGWLGRKVPIKRLDRIVEISKRLPNCIFLIAGDGDAYLSNYSQPSFEYKNSNILEIGVSTPELIWTISDICLSVSDNEGIPISPIESSLAGVPVIATDVGSSNEVVVHGVTGFLCEPNTDSIFASLVLLVDDRDRRRIFGRSAHSFAKAKFDSTRCLETYLAGFNLVLSNPN